MQYSLEGKVVLITGSSRGIGASIAKRLASEKCNVIINYNKSKEQAEAVLRECQQCGGDHMLIHGDMTCEEQVKQLCKEVMSKYGHIDALINNAGIALHNMVYRMKEEQWDQVLQANLKSTFLCSKYFSKPMMKQKQGKIVNVASYVGEIGCSGQASYAASKAGMIAFTKSLSKEIGAWGVLVNAVCPGYIQTELENREKAINISSDNTKQEWRDYLEVHDYLDVLLNFITFMCSDCFHSITGQVFRLDARH